MNYRSISDLDNIIREKLWLIPRDVELIAGVPRSGMLPATLLSVYLNLPLTDTMSLFSEFNHPTATRNFRIKSDHNTTDIRSYKKILIIDDSCNTGLSMGEIKDSVAALIDCKTEIIYACVYAAPQAKQHVDLYFEIVPQPRVFEWNVMNHSIIGRACVDMDGVLCMDPTSEQNDDGDRYIDFILNATPLWIPKFTIGAIVTSRLEKYRSYTEQWLSSHGVKYENLIMLNLPSKEERIRLGAHAPFKAAIYDKVQGTELFIESDPGQASYIHDATGKAVYCVSDNHFYDEDSSMKDYLDLKHDIDDYRTKLTGIFDQIRQLCTNLKSGNPDDYNIGIINAVRGSLEIVLNDIRNTYGNKTADKITERCDIMRPIDKSGGVTDLVVSLTENIENITSLCNSLLDNSDHIRLIEAADKVSDAAWGRELNYIQNILNKTILNDNYSWQDQYDQSLYSEETAYLKRLGHIQMYPYKWTEEYSEEMIAVHTHVTGMKYVMHNGHLLFLPPYNDDLAKHEYNQLIMEQDKRSPHRYFDDICDFEEGDIFVDVGAAEGMISLDILDKAGEIYLIECADRWISALEETFKDHMQKVHIVKKYAGYEDTDTTITLDNLLHGYNNTRIFIKMDIEGMELDALRGAQNVLKNNKCHVSCAVYHTCSQEKEVMDFLTKSEYVAYPSEGYVLFIYGHMVLMNGKYDRIAPPYYRRAIVRAVPKDQFPPVNIVENNYE